MNALVSYQLRHICIFYKRQYISIYLLLSLHWWQCFVSIWLTGKGLWIDDKCSIHVKCGLRHVCQWSKSFRLRQVCIRMTMIPKQCYSGGKSVAGPGDLYGFWLAYKLCVLLLGVNNLAIELIISLFLLLQNFVKFLTDFFGKSKVRIQRSTMHSYFGHTILR